MKRAIKDAICGIAATHGWTAEPFRTFVLAHSLGSLEALSLSGEAAAATKAEHGDKDEGVALQVLGCALVSPFGLRPHKAIRMLAKKRSGENRMFANAALTLPWLEPLTAPILHFLSTKVVGFGGRASAAELYWMLKRAAASDYGDVRVSYTRIREAGFPIFVFFGDRDDIMERAIHEEVARYFDPPLIADECNGNGIADGRIGELQRATMFGGGTHYTVKSHAREIAVRLGDWMGSVDRRS
jgi:pimeloyl-ACP methyl ester carboxylesterase